MPESNGPHLASGDEGEAMTAAGVALYEAMERLVDAQPSYSGAAGPERIACVARLCQQAIAAAVVDKLPDNGQGQTYALVSSVGRLIGQLIVTGPPGSDVRIMTFLGHEARVGAVDLARVLTPKGHG